MPTQFTWIPFYRELTERLLTFEERQDELIDTLVAMREDDLAVMFLDENVPTGGRAQLTVMDPFTFLLNMNITTPEKQGAICAWLKERWQLLSDAPTDFKGLPKFQPLNPWFFWDATARQPRDIPLLWQMARTVYNVMPDQLDAELYAQCFTIKAVKLAKLSTGLYWFRPHEHLPIVRSVLQYLSSQGVTFSDQALRSGNYQEYLHLVENAKAIDPNLPALVQRAWDEKPAKVAKPSAASPDVEEVEADDEQDTVDTALPLNTILYGPPGTGKTYSSVSRAVAIIDGAVPDDRARCMRRFEALREVGRIGFVTFHQSFSYEEFVEGLRPVLDDDDSDARYQVRNGIFKDLARLALGAALTPAQPNRATFTDLWTAFTEKVESQPNWRLPGLSSGSRYRIWFTSRNNVKGENELGSAQEAYNASPKKIEIAFNALRNEPTPTHNVLMSILKVGSHTNLIGAIIEELKRLDKTGITPTPFSELPEQKAESFARNEKDYKLKTEPAPRHVLIIDEINRGNISKIFGELITLLEDDKRLGQLNQLQVELPYSREKFGVPSNLYLVGTMNTADKSLALLDVALRRRFTFEEMRPDFDICWEQANRMKDVLQALNRRLMQVLDREHRIGHAFFMGVTEDNFNTVFAAKIVPLLQEYFYNDWEGLRSVLGENNENGQIVCKLAEIAGVRSRNRYAWWQDADQATPEFLDVLSTNYGLSPT